MLNGTLPGDYGYDPLGLAKDAETLAKYRANELLHARWAMLAAAGAIIPEGLAANGADVKGATWFETGAAMLNGGTLNWFAVPFVNFNNPLPLFAVVAINVALMAAAENYRRTGEEGQGCGCMCGVQCLAGAWSRGAKSSNPSARQPAQCRLLAP